MSAEFTLEYWLDDGWYVGRLREWPAVCSQGETLAELEDNIREAYEVMTGEPLAPDRCLALTIISACAII
jgi:predicted RNase H-like HicB family nuclease